MLQALFLGVLQGLTEFLPVSSSGHLRLVQDVLGWDTFNLAFDTMLHVATVLSVIVYFREDLWRMLRAVFSPAEGLRAHRRLAWLVIAATVPTGIIGLLGGDWFETADLLYVGIAFLVTSASLVAADRFSYRATHDASRISLGRALLVGVAQGCAIMPGVSRSGATMSAGLSLGLDREQAARFSFLLSTPIILLAGAKQALEVLSGDVSMPSLAASLIGFVAAAVTGYAAIAGLMAYIRSRSFLPFAVYTALIGLAVIVWRLAVV